MVEAAVFPDRVTLLQAVRDVLAQYAGTPITLRQGYYRLVAAHIIPNSFRSYKNLGSAVTKWRRDGTIPIVAFEDRTRGMAVYDEGRRQDNPKGWLLDYMRAGMREAMNYHLAKWYGQPYRVVVAVEKQALEGPFRTVCEDLGVDLAVCRGYPSISFLAEWADKMSENDGRQNIILYYGDHDASGENIPEVVERDLGGELFHEDFEFHKIALTGEQAKQMKLYPAPVKLTDSRAARFVMEHGDEVFELDAIDPKELDRILRESVLKYWDTDAEKERDDTVERGKKTITRILHKSGVTKLIAQLQEDVSKDDDDEEDGGDDVDE